MAWQGVRLAFNPALSREFLLNLKAPAKRIMGALSSRHGVRGEEILQMVDFECRMANSRFKSMWD